MIAPSPHDAGTAFVVFDYHRRGDMQPYAFRVSDHGRKWESLVSDVISGYALSILQDPVDPRLLFLGTEFGLYVSTDGGGEWFRFTAGLPTVSVMDMAIQPREDDLVLGTHGRSVYVLDDYSALRGISQSVLDQRLRILSLTPGQQYAFDPTSSTRFTGSGEFRGSNEPYGVVVTFVASGADLPHPDADAERLRAASAAAGSRGKDGEDAAPGLPKVEMTVRDPAGQVIRSQRFPVHQGVNRVTWGMRHDGVRPPPGPEPAKLEDGLPDGPEVPPGDYSIELTLVAEGGDAVTSTGQARVLGDPRSSVSAAERARNYEALLGLQSLTEAAVTSIEQIVQARSDTDTVLSLVRQRKQPGADLDEALKALDGQAAEVHQRLNELEERFRVPPGTKGIPYDDDKVLNRIGMAQFYVGSHRGAPSATAAAYVTLAEQTLLEAQAALDRFVATELADFRRAVEAAGIGLFAGVAKP